MSFICFNPLPQRIKAGSFFVFEPYIWTAIGTSMYNLNDIFYK